VFTRVYPEQARLAAETADAQHRLGMELPSLAGVPISVKDLFDVKGEPTTAGSRVLAHAPVAPRDAEVVRRLRQAGAAIIGKTNMTEFAFSGLGLNPHYGTPLNAWDRGTARIPGGSSSGAAVSVTDGMAEAAIGTDTGGSCRIPAALNGIVGMKPSAQAVPMDGVLPLSASYDSVGPIAKDVETCARVFEVLSGREVAVHHQPGDRLTLGAISNYVLEDLDPIVAATYESALKRLSRSGFIIRDLSVSVLDEISSLFANGGVVAAEAYAWHRDLLATQEAQYDPRVSARIRRGALQSAADYISTLRRRRELIGRWTEEVQGVDAVVMPTVPLIAPKLDDLEDDEEYGRINLLMLRNPTVVNALDGCAISLPCHVPGEAPVGLTIACANGRDSQLLSMAKLVQAVLSAG